MEWSCVSSLFTRRVSLLLAFVSSLWGPSVDKPCSTHGVSRPLFASVLNVNRQTGVVRALGRVFSIKEADQANRERGLRETKVPGPWKRTTKYFKRIVFQVKSRSLSESREVKKVDNIKDEVWKSENRCRSSSIHIIVVTEDDKSLTDNTRRFSRGRASASRIKLPTGGFAQWVGYKGVGGGEEINTPKPLIHVIWGHWERILNNFRGC